MCRSVLGRRRPLGGIPAPGALFLILFLLTDAARGSSPVPAQEPQGRRSAPFGWDVMTGTESTPGTSLTLKEVGRMKVNRSTAITYEARVTGFSPEDGAILVRRLMDERYVTLPMVLDQDDPTLLRPNLTVTGFVPGEAVEIAFFTRDGSKHAQAKAFPFPIEARGEGGCRATVQAVRTGGGAFAILLQGFTAGEEIQVVARLKKKEDKASIRCEDKPLLLRATFAPKERGDVTYTAMGKSCRVTISFKVGKDAVVPARRSLAPFHPMGPNG
jgi:hypothetical protein